MNFRLSLRPLSKVILVIALLNLLSCDHKKQSLSNIKKSTNVYLNSFSESKAKSSIINFVESVTDKDHKDYIPPKDRIVCFDNDGTLWVEQPLPTQAYFAFDRIKDLAKDHPEWLTSQPFKAVIENDKKTIKSFSKSDLLKILLHANAIDDVDKFDDVVNAWLVKSKDHKFKKRYDQLVYRPMLELLDYLRSKDFNIYIVSGGSVEFMRAWAPITYKIPQQNIIGTRLKTEAIEKNGITTIKRLPELEFNNDKMGKVISIEKFIGKKPIMVVGNSDGDLAMMKYAYSQNNKTLMIYLHHNDSHREYFYDDQVLAGGLKEGLKVAQQNQWTIINMKKDWNTVF